jgi:serine/threonine protein kinase/formylglycine-generating enzyme required for sulfatase activity
MVHLSDETVAALAAGRLLESQLAAASEHLASCDECTDLLAAALDGSTSKRASLDPDGLAGREAPARWPEGAPRQIAEFRLIRVLGQGAMGTVFLGKDELLDRPVAVKLLPGRPGVASGRPAALAEAKALARITHPNVVAVYQSGVAAGFHYVAYEYVRGLDLSRIEKPLPGQRVLRIGRKLASGLGAVHRSNLLHRDLKPANVILAEGDEPKLVDFGLAAFVDSADAGGTPARRIVGTPAYMAPETLRGEPASRASDIYSFGAILFELCSGRSPRTWRRGEHGREASAPLSLAQAAPGVEGALAGVIDRCLDEKPELRPASGEVLREALQALEWAARPRPLRDGNPYRGLEPFDESHQDLFFGRDSDVSAIIDRLKQLAGAAGGLFACRSLLPGRRPLAALSLQLARHCGLSEEAAQEALRSDPARFLRFAPDRVPGTLLLLVDQLEELATQSAADEVEPFCEALLGLTHPASGVKLLLVARADFLPRLASLPRLGVEIPRALHFVRALDADGVRAAIVAPALDQGFHFESEAMVADLARAIAPSTAGLPLLEFALSELWKQRDRAAHRITAASLRAIGGVQGALARHAEETLRKLSPSGREAARRILLRLVSREATRVWKTEGELELANAESRAALEALVAGRLVFVTEREGTPAYELAHETLIESWALLRSWLDRDASWKESIAAATVEWRAAGKLWNPRQLAEVEHVDRAGLTSLQASFLDASRRDARYVQNFRRVVAGAVLLLVCGAAAFWLYLRYQRSADVARHVALAEEAIARAGAMQAEAAVLRSQAFALFDARGPGAADQGSWEQAELVWSRVLARQRAAETSHGDAERALEAAVLRDSGDARARDLLADVIQRRIELARIERDPDRDRLHDYAERLKNLDSDGRRRRALETPALLRLTSAPSGAAVEVARYLEEGRRRVLSPATRLGVTPLSGVQLEPGSYLLSLRAAGLPPVRFPLLVDHESQGRTLASDVPIPAAIPAGYVYVPPGCFLSGDAGQERYRQKFMHAPPLHRICTGGYLIGRHEVTMAEWIDYLEDLPPGERARKTPALPLGRLMLRLARDAAGRWHFTMKPGDRPYAAGEGEPIRYAGRRSLATQDWKRFPVAGIRYRAAEEYLAWLSSTRRLPGARLCDELEWERAARGADDRIFPHGDDLAPGEANYDETYGRVPSAYGPDEVGSHPASVSPFGVFDLAGNVWEWVRSIRVPGEPVYRGGSWYSEETAAYSMNRNVGEQAQEDATIGLRACADLPRDGASVPSSIGDGK